MIGWMFRNVFFRDACGHVCIWGNGVRTVLYLYYGGGWTNVVVLCLLDWTGMEYVVRF